MSSNHPDKRFGRQAGNGQGSGPSKKTSKGETSSQLANPVQPPVDTPGPSMPQRTQSHSDPFHSLEPPSFDRKGPRDPNQGPREPVFGRPQQVKKSPIDGFQQKAPFCISTWPGVVWYNGVIKKPNKADVEVVARVTKERVAYGLFKNCMINEREVMGKLDHRYILRCIGWDERLNKDGELEATAAIFPKCGKDLERHVRGLKFGPVKFQWSGKIPPRVPRRPYEEKKLKPLMGQLADALAYMHERNHVHTRIHPSSVRLHGHWHIRLSRLMYVQKCLVGRPAKGSIPIDATEYFFLSPTRYRQEVNQGSIFKPTMTPEQIASDKARLFPHDDVQWDGKKDDIWAFGCVVFFCLTAKYPYSKKKHSGSRAMLEAFHQNFFLARIRESPTLSHDAREFLLWILKPNQRDRPTADQILNHSWIRSGYTSPGQNLYMSNDKNVYGKTFTQVPGHIDDGLIRKMTEKGYAIEHLLGKGGFGAVYKGIKLEETGARVQIAMKVIKDDKKGSTFKSHRWTTEQKAMTFDHPNLVKVYDVDTVATMMNRVLNRWWQQGTKNTQ